MEKITDFNKEEIKEIETDFKRALENDSENTKSNSGEGFKTDSYLHNDFLSNDLMGVILGFKNSFIVSVLAKELDMEAKDILSDLYKATAEEIKIYRAILQRLIRELFPEKIEDIANAINKDYAAAIILESVRLHQAKNLIRAARSRPIKDK